MNQEIQEESLRQANFRIILFDGAIGKSAFDRILLGTKKIALSRLHFRQSQAPESEGKGVRSLSLKGRIEV